MDWVAYAVGAFYVFAGIVALRAGRMSMFLDKTLQALTRERTPFAEHVRAIFLIGGSVLTLAGGLALLALSRWAVTLFTASLAAQAAYLLWATRALPPEDTLEAAGRQRTINASVVYAAATALVIWLDHKGLLH